MTLLVFAQSYVHYKEWLRNLRDSGDNLSRTKHITDPHDLMGWDPNSIELVFLPNWYEGYRPEYSADLLRQVDYLRTLKEKSDEEESA